MFFGILFDFTIPKLLKNLLIINKVSNRLPLQYYPHLKI